MTITATLTEQYVWGILQQESEGEAFPIDFDDVWESAGYTEKRNAVRFLKSCEGLEKGKDYKVCSEVSQTPQGGRSSNLIRLSSDGYEFFLSRSQTKQGNANLRCLIEIKKAYLQQLERQLKATVEDASEVEILKAEIEKLKKDGLEFARDQMKFINYTQREHKKLKQELDEAITYGMWLTQHGFDERLEQANAKIEQLTKENEKLKEENDYEEISPDVRMRRVYWYHLTTLFAENQDFRQQLGLPLKK